MLEDDAFLADSSSAKLNQRAVCDALCAAILNSSPTSSWSDIFNRWTRSSALNHELSRCGLPSDLSVGIDSLSISPLFRIASCSFSYALTLAHSLSSSRDTFPPTQSDLQIVCAGAAANELGLSLLESDSADGPLEDTAPWLNCWRVVPHRCGFDQVQVHLHFVGVAVPTWMSTISSARLDSQITVHFHTGSLDAYLSRSQLPQFDAFAFFQPGLSCPDYDWSNSLKSLKSYVTSQDRPILVLSTAATEIEQRLEIDSYWQSLVTPAPATQPNPYPSIQVEQSGTMADDAWCNNRSAFVWLSQS